MKAKMHCRLLLALLLTVSSSPVFGVEGPAGPDETFADELCGGAAVTPDAALSQPGLGTSPEPLFKAENCACAPQWCSGPCALNVCNLSTGCQPIVYYNCRACP